MSGNRSLETFRDYLPRYLSEEDLGGLFAELRQFPENIDSRFYTRWLQNDPQLFQGDGIRDLPAVQFPHTEVRDIPALILSNTCDVNLENTRLYPNRVIYAPIVRLAKLEAAIRNNGVSDERVKSFLFDLKRQHISTMFYLPDGAGLQYESVVLLDRTNNCPLNSAQENLFERRLFTLSNYGFYVLLFKLSLHFCRVREQVNRG